MLVMWKTDRGNAEIQRQECTRATSASVWLMARPFSIGGDEREMVEKKAARHSSRVNYHATWDDAHLYLLEDAAFSVQSKRRQLELANAHHGNVKGLRKPADAEFGAA